MFGNNVQSSWGQQNQQQQPSQSGSAFGQPSAFGSGGAFGQTQQQQQPQANPMFGSLGTTGTNTGTTGGFGAFGGNNNASAGTTNSLFGAPKPATGFGAFGGGGNTSTFGGGGTFGSTAATAGTTGTGIFGQANNNTSTSAFGGGGGGLFGNKTTTGFGAATNTDNPAPVSNGTAGTAFSAFSEKDGNLNLQYQSITAMPVYRGSSYEELRVQDYLQGRKTAGAAGTTGAFGQPTFGASAVQSSTSTTGGGLFGQPAPAATNSIFGGGAFPANNQAAPAPSTGFGAFGQSTQPSAPATTNIFGGGGGFGQSQTQQPSTGFGAFGQPGQPAAPAATGNSIFGGGFGQNNNQAQPAGAFGGGFNSITSTGKSIFGGSSTGGFGTQTQQQPAPTGLFGQPAQPANNTFGALGNNNNAPKPSLFGPPAAQATTGFGAFGPPAQQNQQQQGQQPTAGMFGNSIFGQNNNQQQTQQAGTQPTGGLFGTQATTQNTGGGLFGGGNGLFGGNSSNQQQQNQQQQGQTGGLGLFGAPKPGAPAAPSGGLFSGTFGQNNTNTNAGGGLFSGNLGQPTNQQQGSNTFSNSLFGKPAAPTLGQSQSTGQSGGLFSSFNNGGSFNASTNASGAQGSLTASINQPIGANLPIFSMLPPGPRAVTLEQPKKKPGFFVDVPTRSPVPRLQLGYTPANTKLRGFGSESTSSMSFSSGKLNALSLSRADSKTPDGFLGRSSSPALGSGGRQSVKKLILDKKVEPSDLFSKSGLPGLRASPGKVTFNPAMSQAARERDVARETTSGSPSLGLVRASPAPSSRSPQPPNHFSANNDFNDKATPAPEAASSEPEEGEYWVKPDLVTLRQAGYTELSSYKDIVVGRVGYGEIRFLEPVDLTGLSKLDELRGLVVRFDDKECTVYPDSDDADKPAPGTGLNVRARITLIRCWAVDKATREPIKDDKHPSAVKHLKRLKNMRDTHFESFDLNEGKWTFTVDHF